MNVSSDSVPPGVSTGAESPILILATTACAYPAADAVGQAHLHYPANTYVLRAPSPVLFPDDFYYHSFEKGVGGILVMSCGHECPYVGAFTKLAARIDRVKLGLRERGIDPNRLRLSAICTVCTKPFLKEIDEVEKLLAVIRGADTEVSA
jgi:F420-non-reducing hydrogenase iron-sulfur subunit